MAEPEEEFIPMMGLENMLNALARLSPIEAKVYYHKRWEEQVREKKKVHQQGLREYEKEMAKRESNSLITELSDLIPGSKTEVELPCRPTLWLPPEPELPTSIAIRLYERITAKIKDFIQTPFPRLNIYIVPETRVFFWYGVCSGSEVGFEGFTLRFSQKDKPRYHYRERVEYDEDHYNCAAYFSLLMLSENEFNEAVSRRELAILTRGTELERPKFEFTDKKKLIDYTQKIRERFKSRGFTNYNIIVCEPEKHTHGVEVEGSDDG